MRRQEENPQGPEIEVAKPLELVYIGGVTTQAPNTQGISANESPFTRSTLGISKCWETRVGSIIDQILSTSPIVEPVHKYISQIAVLSFSGNRSLVIDFIKSRIQARASDITDNLKECQDVAEFGQKIGQLMKNLQLLTSLFNCFRVDFERFAYQTLKDLWTDKDMMTTTCQMAVKNFGKGDVQHYGVDILDFLDALRVLNDQAVLREIALPLMALIHSTAATSANGDRMQLFRACYDTFATMCNSLPKIIQATISEGFTSTLIKGDLQTFLSVIIPHILSSHTDWSSYIYSSSNTRETVTELARAVEALPFDVERVLMIQKAIRNWPAHLRRLIENALRHITTGHAKELSLAVVSQLRTYAKRTDLERSIVNVIGLIEDQEVFESLYAQELLRHCITGNTEIDREFIKVYIDTFSKVQALKFISILDDYDEGKATVAAFSGQVPAFMGYRLIWGGYWHISRYSLAYPREIEASLSTFVEYFNHLPDMSRKRIEFDASLSQVVLECNGVSIHCDALVATVLLAISNGCSTLSSLEAAVKMEKPVFESIIHVLCSEQGGRVCVQNGDELKISLHDLHKEIEIPSAVKRTEYYQVANGGAALLMSQNSQIESLILMTLKKDGPSHASSLFKQVRDLVKFNISEDAFLQRLEKLEKRYFIEKDRAGQYHFVP